MSLQNILQWSYWFTPPYPLYHAVRVVWLVGFGTVIAVGLVALILKTQKSDNILRVIFGRVATWGITMGLLGMLIFSFRQEGIALFSWRIWPLLWLVGALVWMGKIIRYVVGRVPQIKAENKAREMRERYLPKGQK